MHNEVLAMAEASLAQSAAHENDEICMNSPDPLVRQGWDLKKRVEQQFRQAYAGRSTERVLIHVPAPDYSPAGYSLFTNMAESLAFIGVPTAILGWEDDTKSIMRDFAPTVLLSSDHSSYLQRIDWNAVAQYRQTQHLKIGLTASLGEYENTPLEPRLKWAKRHGVNFYYSFRDKGYVSTRAEYRPFFDSGCPMVYLPFGANVLHYYPVGGIKRDLDYVIMATRKSEHMSYMKSIAQLRAGFIDGPGWRHVHNFRFNRDRDRYVYARARVGLNVHLPEQIEWACELNERTYQLAACGVPQLVDHPKLIDQIFSSEAIFVADTPTEYERLFLHMIHHPEEAEQRALQGQKEVFARHTTFHRAEDFVRQLTLTLQ